MKLRIVPGTPAPDTPTERVRKTAAKARPHCLTCGGGEYVTARIGKTTAKLCVGCLTQGRRREMTPAG